jgi:hypothetical protein
MDDTADGQDMENGIHRYHIVCIKEWNGALYEHLTMKVL